MASRSSDLGMDRHVNLFSNLQRDSQPEANWTFHDALDRLDTPAEIEVESPST